VVPVITEGLAGWATLAGLGLGFGLWLLVGLVPRLGRPSLALRIAPYVASVSNDARQLLARQSANPLPLFGMVFGPFTHRMRSAALALAGDSESLRRALRQAASPVTVDEFRSRQLSASMVGAIVGIVVVAVAGQSAAVSPVAAVTVPALAAGVGFWCPDMFLRRAARQRVARLSEEFPTVLEFLTLSLSAGEGILDAIRRVAELGSGELASELRGVVSSVHTGVPLGSALEKLSDDLRLSPVTRCIEQLVGGMERGTPLVEVLRAQAQDSRDESKRILLAIAGRKEVAMLVPVNRTLGFFFAISEAAFDGEFRFGQGLGRRREGSTPSIARHSPLQAVQPYYQSRHEPCRFRSGESRAQHRPHRVVFLPTIEAPQSFSSDRRSYALSPLRKPR